MTEPSLTTVEPTAQPDAKQRERSTIGFPYNDLNDGVGVARAVHALGDRCTHDQLAPQLGYSTIDNGAYLQRLATARHFGLVSTAKDGVTITPLGHRMVDPPQEAGARAEAFMTVPLYRALYDRYRGYPLPSSNIGLEAVLVELGVAAKQKDKARQALQRSAEQAGYFVHGRERLVAPALVAQTVNPSDASPTTEGEKGGGGGGGPKLPTLIRGLIESLPPEGGSWKQEDRDQWLKAVTLLVDMVYKIEPLRLEGPKNDNHAYSDPPGDR